MQSRGTLAGKKQPIGDLVPGLRRTFIGVVVTGISRCGLGGFWFQRLEKIARRLQSE